VSPGAAQPSVSTSPSREARSAAIAASRLAAGKSSVTGRPMADEHGSELTLRHEAERVTLDTDPRRVRQILLNLLSNAIKYGNGQPIAVETRPTESGGIVISVADRGVGIAPDDMQRIFDEFVQLEPTRQQGGTGLGLPISRRLAQLLGGSLTVESKVGEGSTFRLELPRSIEEKLRERDRDVRPPRDVASDASDKSASASPPATPGAPAVPPVVATPARVASGR
jgi:signal transduction histidine kinase